MICDFAETYHIFNYRSLPVNLVATFFYGLGENSRTKMAMRGERITADTALLAIIADRIGKLIYKDPPSIFNKLMDLEEDKTSEVMSFATAEEFDAYFYG